MDCLNTHSQFRHQHEVVRSLISPRLRPGLCNQTLHIKPGLTGLTNQEPCMRVGGSFYLSYIQCTQGPHILKGVFKSERSNSSCFAAYFQFSVSLILAVQWYSVQPCHLTAPGSWSLVLKSIYFNSSDPNPHPTFPGAPDQDKATT